VGWDLRFDAALELGGCAGTGVGGVGVGVVAMIVTPM
jgi:hypothetical protein